jgi:adenylate cyclase
LIQEWFAGARPERVRYLVAACASDSSARAYALVAELARVLLEMPGELPDASFRLLSDLVGAGATIPALSGSAVDALALEGQYASALVRLLKWRAGDAALVLVCEDLHWADAASVEVLRRVMEQPNPPRLLVCLTLRPDRDAPGWKLIDTGEELPGVAAVRLHLTPLARDDTQRLLASLLPGILPEKLEALVLANAEGNPLFVEELVRMLLDRGDLVRMGERWHITRELVALDVPPTLQGVLMARVDQLPPDARHVLQVASVLGREFPLELLEQVLAEIG